MTIATTQFGGSIFKSGSKTGTGSSITILTRFKPAFVEVENWTNGTVMKWCKGINAGDNAGYGFKTVNDSDSRYETLTGSDIKGSANTDSENSDAASLPTNGALLKAADTITNYSSPVSSITEPDMARNVGIFITNDSGGALNLYEGVTTYTITGTFNGAAQTETITFTSSAGNKSVANNKYRYKYGVKPFDTITTVAYDNAPAATLKLSVGIGSKMGLANSLYNAATSSVSKITKNAADLATTSIVNATYNTVNLGTLADGDDFTITYAVAVGSSGAVTSGGITQLHNGFKIGTDTDLNVNGDTLIWKAFASI